MLKWTSSVLFSRIRRYACFSVVYLLAVFGLVFGFISESVSASESMILEPVYFQSTWHNNTGGSGTWTGTYQNHETQFTFGAASEQTNLQFYGGNLGNLQQFDKWHVKISFKIQGNATTTNYPYNAPSFVTPGWFHSTSTCATMDNITSVVTPNYGSTNEFNYQVDIIGDLWAESSDSRICFTGAWLSNLGTNTWTVKMSAPSISINPDWDYRALLDINSSISSGNVKLDQITSIIQGISVNGVKQDNSDIIASTDKTTEAVKEQTEATKEQTQQDKEQYEQEKQEEADRENQGKLDLEQASSLFNFSVLNPFDSLFSAFKPGDGCVSIPTIARWLHSDNTQYCSWWPNSVRSVLTPVFSIASMMLIFGFVVRWLGGSEVFKADVSGGY